jgi:hypothetical protein
VSVNEVAPWDSLPAHLSWKEKIAYLGVCLSEMPGERDCPVEHTFGHGIYLRRIAIPAHTIFLGREHLKGHEVTLLEGSVILITEHGKQQFDAVTTVLTRPGFHTVCYTLTPVIAQTVHPNPDNIEDTDRLEREIFGSVEELRALGLLVQARLRLAA